MMHYLVAKFGRIAQLLAVIGLALLSYLVVRGVLGEQPVHALPEYADRTGEPCAACHVSAGGGGPRTLSGMLWSARGRPDDLPELPNPLLAPGVESGSELYDIACSGCHGFSGEGLVGMDLANRGISRTAARSFIRDGIPELGMPAFGEKVTPEQLEALSAFVAALGAGDIPPVEYPLPPPVFDCALSANSDCAGN